jgi:Zn ribbon nucleic-acid-binding protein
MSDLLLFPDPEPAIAGVVCPGCRATEFRSSWQTFKGGKTHCRLDCAQCGRFVQWAPKESCHFKRLEPRPAGRPQPKPMDLERCDWIGLVRPDGGDWHAVARAATLPRCWDALLTCPMLGDHLIIPTERGCIPWKEAA